MITQARICADNEDTNLTIEEYKVRRDEVARAQHRCESQAHLVGMILEEHRRALRDGALREEFSTFVRAFRSAPYDGVPDATLARLIELLHTVRPSDLIAELRGSPRLVLSPADRAHVLARQHGVCFSCRTLLTGYWELDHHLPRALGGLDDLDNRRALCVDCNRKKGRQHPEVFYGDRYSESVFA